MHLSSLMQLFCPVLTLGKCSCLCRILIHGLHRFHPGLNFLVNAWTNLAMAAATCTSTHATTGKLGQNPCASCAICAAQVTLAPDIPMQLYIYITIYGPMCLCPLFPFLAYYFSSCTLLVQRTMRCQHSFKLRKLRPLSQKATHSCIYCVDLRP